MLVYLRVGFAQTVVHAATLRSKLYTQRKKVTYQAVFFRDAPQLVWSFSPAQPCARYSRAFNSSTRIVYLAVFK